MHIEKTPIRNEIGKFLLWLKIPPTRQERIASLFFSLTGGFFIGILGRLMIEDAPLMLPDGLVCGFGMAFVFAILSLIYPKQIAAMMFFLGI